MAIPINIEDLLSKQKVESNRIEFNPNRSLGFLCVVRQREIL